MIQMKCAPCKATALIGLPGGGAINELLNRRNADDAVDRDHECPGLGRFEFDEMLRRGCKRKAEPSRKIEDGQHAAADGRYANRHIAAARRRLDHPTCGVNMDDR